MALLKKRLRPLALALALAVCLGLGGCGGSVFSSDLSSGAAASPGESPGWSENAAMDTAGGEGSVLTQGRKIIYNADLSLESTDFEGCVAALEKALAQVGGYKESSSQSGSAETGSRYAQYVYRVPSSGYRAFLQGAENAGNLTYQSESTQDVTGAYVDVTARLESLESQRQRLAELQEQATSLEDLLAIEAQLTEVQYQIESYTAQKDLLDDQIDYCTVTVELNEVRLLTPQTTSFAARLGAAFVSGWEGFGSWLQELAIGLAEAWPFVVLVVLAALLVAARARRRGKPQKKAKGGSAGDTPPKGPGPQPPQT